MVTLNPCSVHPSTHEVLYSILNPSNKAATIPLNPTLAQDYYEIDYIRPSENAWQFFTRNAVTNSHVVIKILRQLKDTRYNLGTIDERQHCQVEALRWNQVFTREVYLGLARICDFDLRRKRIGISKIIVEPDKEKLDLNVEHALLMYELPKNRRLDVILKEGNKIFNQNGDKTYLQNQLQILTRYVAYLHTNADINGLTELPLTDNDILWGSVEKLREKLIHNFAFVNYSLMNNKEHYYTTYYQSLKNTLSVLENDLLQIFSGNEWNFDHRVKERRVRRCHGDLKARNIWIHPCDTGNDEEPWKQVSVLDAVDFNPLYSNIDILSDFAMLVVDVQARTKSSSLADSMIKDYLRLTKQQDKVSRFVLAYYLVEKAFVGAIVNIIYDNWPNLGLSFLNVAERRMKDLKRQNSVQQHVSTDSLTKFLTPPSQIFPSSPGEVQLLI